MKERQSLDICSDVRSIVMTVNASTKLNKLYIFIPRCQNIKFLFILCQFLLIGSSSYLRVNTDIWILQSDIFGVSSEEADQVVRQSINQEFVYQKGQRYGFSCINANCSAERRSPSIHPGCSNQKPRMWARSVCMYFVRFRFPLTYWWATIAVPKAR